VQGYQCRIEQARLQYHQTKSSEYTQEADEGQGEIEMLDANFNLVQNQLSELRQQVVHIVQACNEEKEILQDKF
jgi:hypothetical protein